MQINNFVIAHRGASAYAPENTLASFDKAKSLGASFIEFDVMLSADGEPFVFHDDSLKRTSNGRGEVGLVEATYLRTLDAGRWFSKKFVGEKIPHFQEVLEWLNASGISANIEIKPYKDCARQTTVSVLSHIHRYWPQNKALPLVSSFDRDALHLSQTLAPELPRGLLLDSWDKGWHALATDFQCYSIHMNKRKLSKNRVKAIKEAGFQLYAYTVNYKRQAKKLRDWGVDAVFSDYPDLLSL